MRLAAVALVVMALLTPMQAAGASAAQRPTLADVLGSFANVDATKSYLPGSNGAVAQDVSDRMFNALANVLGGSAPKLNFVQQTDPNGEFNASADVANNRINVDPTVMGGLVDPRSQYHNGSVNGLPHEMMHLRQTPAVLGDRTQREGGAQAFADLVTPGAAKAAHVPYSGVPGAFDGSYAPLVQLIQKQYGRDWILGGQMGKPPVSFP